MPYNPGTFGSLAVSTAPQHNGLEESYDSGYYKELGRAVEVNLPSHRWRFQWMGKMVHIAPGERAVDLGSGAGTVSEFLADHGATVEAVDLSEAAVAFARQRAGNRKIHYTVGDASRCTHLSDGTFDKATCSDLIEHVDDSIMLGLFREAYRLLRSGGQFYVYSPNRSHWIERLKDRNFILKQFPQHTNVRAIAEVVEALKSVGFKIERIARPPSMLPVVKWLEWLWIHQPVCPDLAIYRVCLLVSKP